MGRLVRLAMIVVVAAGLAMCGYWIVRQAYQGQPTTDLRSLAAQACASPATPAQRTDCVQLAAAVSADDSADLSRLALLLSLAGTVVAAIGTGIVVRSLDHSRRAVEASAEANRIATDATEAQNRAWLSFEVGDVKLSSVNGNLRLVSNITYTCHGQTPARDVSHCYLLVFGEPASEARILLDQFASGEIPWTNGAFFPGTSKPDSFGTIADNSPKGFNKAHLLIGVSYRTAFTDKRRFTILAWSILSADHSEGLIDPAYPPARGNIVLARSDTFSGIIT